MYKFTLALLALISLACGRNTLSDSSREEELHQHEDAASQSTLFTDNTEFYIEHDQLQPGKESAFLVHVTHLGSYKPYLSGTLTIRLDDTELSASEPEQPGIFHIPFTPVKGGEFKVTYTLESDSIQETVSDHFLVDGEHQDILESMDDHAGHEGHDASEEGHDEDVHNTEGPVLGEILFPKEQAWKNDFMVSQVFPAPFSSVISHKWRDPGHAG